MTHNMLDGLSFFVRISFVLISSFIKTDTEDIMTFLLYVAPQHNSGLFRPIVEVSRSHTIRHTNIR
jgi:hypothetical protein